MISTRVIDYCSFAAVALFICACNPTKLVPANDALYTGATVKLTNSSAPKKINKVLQGDLVALTRPRPNSKLFGMRLKLGFYNMAGRGKGFISKFIRKLGEPPVLLSQVSLEKNIQLLQNTLENKGFFHAKVSGDTIVNQKRRMARAEYVANAGIQYKINEVTFPADSLPISQAIRSISDKSLLKKGDPFVLDVVKGERLRIDAALKEKGFYYFAPDDLITLVDSTIGGNLANLHVEFKPEMPIEEKQAFRIGDVYIYANYSLRNAKDTARADSVYYLGYHIIDKRKMFSKKLFPQIMKFKEGDLYNRTDHNTSLSRLINLGVFQYVKNRFEPRGDTAKLDAFYYLTPSPKKAINLEIGGNTKSNNATGSEVTLRWRNRNTFKRAELLTLATYFGTEVQYSGQYSGFNTLRYGAEFNFAVPRFVVPFFHVKNRSAFVPRTNMQLGYDILNRTKLYALTSYRGQLGYIWKESVRKEHQLNPIAINYVLPTNITDTFRKSYLLNPTLKHTVDTQFTIGSTYNFNYNQLVNKEKFATGLYFNGLLDLSGNIAGLLSNASAKDSSYKTILGKRFAQYIKAEFDTRYYIKIGTASQWANRIIIGLGFPYGNSRQMPFVKQYFVGGNNSLRGFRSRSVGPGVFPRGVIPAPTGILPDVTGDIKFEVNTEYRPHLSGVFYGAVFLDAGNVWLYNDDPNQPGAKFSASRFLKELAADAGIGLRIDVTILLLRLDVAFPIRQPFLEAGQEWLIRQIQLGNSAWRKNNLVFNLGIGMPF